MNRETKVVLGRVFTESLLYSDTWECHTTTGYVALRKHANGTWDAALYDSDDEFVTEAEGPTETAAILALQSQLRKDGGAGGGGVTDLKTEITQRTSHLLGRAITDAGLTVNELSRRLATKSSAAVNRTTVARYLTSGVPRVDTLAELLELCGFELCLSLKRTENDDE